MNRTILHSSLLFDFSLKNIPWTALFINTCRLTFFLTATQYHNYLTHPDRLAFRLYNNFTTSAANNPLLYT